MKFFSMLCIVCSKGLTKKMNYDTTILEITNAAKIINIQKTGSDGRIDSAMKEEPFLTKLKEKLKYKSHFYLNLKNQID